MGRAGVAYTDGLQGGPYRNSIHSGNVIFSWHRREGLGYRDAVRVTSIPELFERRFGRAAKITLSVLIAFAMMGTVASQVTATATIIRMLGGRVRPLL